MSAVGWSERVTAASRESLPGATEAGRKSATAAAIKSSVARGRACITASRISAEVVTETSSAPAGGVSALGAETRMTRAPRFSASSARAKPMRPLERLPRKRTPSIGSRVPAGGDEDSFELEVARLESGLHGGLHGGDDVRKVGEASTALHAAGEMAGGGLDQDVAASAQEGGVCLHRGMLPHDDVHRRRDDDGRGRGEIKGGDEVVGKAVGQLCQHVGGGGHDDQRGGGLGFGDVLDGGVALRDLGAGPQRGDDAVAADGGKGERRDKLFGGGGHGDVGVEAGLLQRTNELDGTVGSDASADADGDFARAHPAILSPLQSGHMICSLRGTLLSKSPNQAVVECAGVGYDVAISVATFSALPKEGAEARLHVYTKVAEDQLALCLASRRLDEKRLFERLIAVSGIGPKLAITVLSGIASERLVTAIRGSDHGSLVKIPGIGKKTAERIVLELKDKLDDLQGFPVEFQPPSRRRWARWPTMRFRRW